MCQPADGGQEQETASPAAVDSCPNCRCTVDVKSLDPAEAGRLLFGEGPPEPNPTYLPPWFGGRPSDLLAFSCVRKRGVARPGLPAAGPPNVGKQDQHAAV